VRKKESFEERREEPEEDVGAKREGIGETNE
jgi:hypothetical protein